MRKLTKAIAAVLLLAVVVGVFAVMPAFAAPITDRALDSEHVTTLFDSDTRTNLAYNKTAKNTKGTAVPTMKKTAEGGNSVWVVDFKDTPAKESVSTANFWTITGIDGIRIRDDAGFTATDGTTTNNRPAQAKDTNYVVIDFDVASDTVLPAKTYFNIRQYPSGKAFVNGSSLSSSSECPMFGVDTAGRFFVSNGNGSNKRYAPVESADKYTHVTLVYDFHPVTAEDGTVTITNKCYAYINGYYAGALGSFDANTVELHWIRVQQESACPTENANVKYANFTIKAFDTEFDGSFTKDGILANTMYPLHMIPELSYALAEVPETPEGYKGFPIAKIDRVGEDDSIYVYDADDLHGDLIDGDVVTVYFDVASLKKAYAVKNIVDESGEDVAPTIIWQDENGIELGEEGSLFSAPAITYVPSNALWAVFKSDGTLYDSGSVAPLASKSSDNKWVVYDGLFQARQALQNSAKTTGEALLFGDYVAYGVGASGTVKDGDTTFSDAGVSPTTSSSTNIRHSKDFTYDLNGYTFTTEMLVNHWMVAYGGQIVMKNGNVIHSSSSNLLMANNYSDLVVLENLNITDDSGKAIVDQRGNLIIFSRCTASMKSGNYLANMKAVGTGLSSIILDNSDVTSLSGTLHVSQTNADSALQTAAGKAIKQRQGGGNIHISVVNSTVNSGHTFVSTETFANGLGHTAASYVANNVDYEFSVLNSNMTTYNVLLSINRSGYVPGYVDPDGTNTDSTSEGKLTLDSDLIVYNSKINSLGIVNIAPNSTDTSLVDFSFDAAITGSELKFYNTAANGNVTVGGFTQLNYDYSICPVNIKVAEGCTFTNVNPARPGDYEEPNIILPEGVQLAHTNTYGEDIGFVATSAFDTYTYQLGELAPVPFYWNQAEGEVFNFDVAAPDLESKAGVYHYEWSNEGNAYKATIVKDFKLSAKTNLTLYDNLYFNVYLNAAQYDAIKDSVTVTDKDGTVLKADAEQVNIDDIAYYKFQAKDIAPAEAGDTAATVAINVAGAYNDVITTGGSFTVLSYASKMLNDGSDETVVLIKALLNYITEAATLAGNTSTADAAGALIVGETFDEVDASEAKFEALEGVEVAIAYGEELHLLVGAAEGTRITVDYTFDGETKRLTKNVGPEGYIAVKIKACDFANDITVTKVATQESATMNVAGYYYALADVRPEAQPIVAAIYNYAKAAAAYKASLEA